MPAAKRSISYLYASIGTGVHNWHIRNRRTSIMAAWLFSPSRRGRRGRPSPALMMTYVTVNLILSKSFYFQPSLKRFNIVQATDTATHVRGNIHVSDAASGMDRKGKRSGHTLLLHPTKEGSRTMGTRMDPLSQTHRIQPISQITLRYTGIDRCNALLIDWWWNGHQWIPTDAVTTVTVSDMKW